MPIDLLSCFFSFALQSVRGVRWTMRKVKTLTSHWKMPSPIDRLNGPACLGKYATRSMDGVDVALLDGALNRILENQQTSLNLLTAGVGGRAGAEEAEVRAGVRAEASAGARKGLESHAGWRVEANELSLASGSRKTFSNACTGPHGTLPGARLQLYSRCAHHFI